MGDKGAFRIGDGNQAAAGDEGRGAGGVKKGPRRSGPVPQTSGSIWEMTGIQGWRSSTVG